MSTGKGIAIAAALVVGVPVLLSIGLFIYAEYKKHENGAAPASQQVPINPFALADATDT